MLNECIISPSIADRKISNFVFVPSTCLLYTSFLIAVLEGVAKNLPGLIQAAVDVLMAFFSGIVDALKGIDTEDVYKRQG